jgi:hypothetical protein
MVPRAETLYLQTARLKVRINGVRERGEEMRKERERGNGLGITTAVW